MHLDRMSDSDTDVAEEQRPGGGGAVSCEGRPVSYCHQREKNPVLQASCINVPFSTLLHMDAREPRNVRTIIVMYRIKYSNLHSSV